MKSADYIKAKDRPRKFGNIRITNKWMQVSNNSLIYRCLEAKYKEVYLSQMNIYLLRLTVVKSTEYIDMQCCSCGMLPQCNPIIQGDTLALVKIFATAVTVPERPHLFS
ncbi:uncharacterized protein LOC127263229 [Andrographis paniculata]|uniref:uncharacterized protein LOC127263229 n=1 Tax=Andrographis paniculata TaxID=175694 RepID=UPI0021E81BAD|nr:uncharacterized protein LOC127263229 [Andrographis paniculata]